MMSSEVTSAGVTLTEAIRMNEMKRTIHNDVDDDDQEDDFDEDSIGGDADAGERRCTSSSSSTAMANDILNDILETAMDIAVGNEITGGGGGMLHEIVDGTQQADEAELKHIIDGLSKINVDKLSAVNKCDSAKTPLNVEMKRFLNEIMTTNNNTAAAVPVTSNNMGIGDSPPPPPPPEVRAAPPLPVSKPSKLIEKKSRITDLVMNSKKALNNMLSEEQRKKQDAWEEAHEHVIQVIELQQQPAVESMPSPETFPLPIDSDDMLVKPEHDDNMESIELSGERAVAGAVGGMATNSGEGDKQDEDDTMLKKKSSLCGSAKKKRWNFNFRFFNFRRNRNKEKKPADESEPIAGIEEQQQQ